ncbi:hypothetical protein GDO78_007749 [Eleutherodactylus coqui]|uniref:Uncharacterized protein n=1 Tax=Eleutherodactylus coqui TaxID=57060 RepID=A0A8J6KCQ7_ELECQ|nr:hypothetical protein GDO78_007749 [Eleutherodactylus coqui]
MISMKQNYFCNLTCITLSHITTKPSRKPFTHFQHKQRICRFVFPLMVTSARFILIFTTPALHPSKQASLSVMFPNVCSSMKCGFKNFLFLSAGVC